MYPTHPNTCTCVRCKVMSLPPGVRAMPRAIVDCHNPGCSTPGCASSKNPCVQVCSSCKEEHKGGKYDSNCPVMGSNGYEPARSIWRKRARG